MGHSFGEHDTGRDNEEFGRAFVTYCLSNHSAISCSQNTEGSLARINHILDTNEIPRSLSAFGRAL
jgi:hypothetical protein